MRDADCIVVGASFAGLACATALARTGMQVTVLEKKADAGEKLHTTGIIVKDAIDQVALLDGLPPELVRRVTGVRLYAPNLQHVDLAAPGYYFLATDTPRVMRWLAGRAEQAGARIAYRAPFREVERTQSGFDLGEFGKTRFLVGADGPNSTVAKALGLGVSSQFLFGVEHEYSGVEMAEPDMLHCFVDRRLAPGYIGWVVSGPDALQVGIARRLRGLRRPAVEAIDEFVKKIAPVFDLHGAKPTSIRAGMIPCGGIVSRLRLGECCWQVTPPAWCLR